MVLSTLWSEYLYFLSVVKTGVNSGLADHFWKTTCFWKEAPLPWKIPFSLYSNTRPYLYIVLNSLRSKAKYSQLRGIHMPRRVRRKQTWGRTLLRAYGGTSYFYVSVGRNKGGTWGSKLRTHLFFFWEGHRSSGSRGSSCRIGRNPYPEGLGVGMLWALVGRAIPTGICLTKHMTMRLMLSLRF